MTILHLLQITNTGKKYFLVIKRVIPCMKNKCLIQSFFLALSTGYSTVCFSIKLPCVIACLYCGLNVF